MTAKSAKIIFQDRIAKEVFISFSLHFIMLLLIIYFPPLLFQMKEKTATEVMLISNIEPIPLPVTNPEAEPVIPKGIPSPQISGKLAKSVAKMPSAPAAASEGIVDDIPVKDIGPGIGIPSKFGSAMGKKEGAAFSKKNIDPDIPDVPDIPITGRNSMIAAKSGKLGLPSGKETNAPASGTLGIKGTAGKRRLIFRPPPPAVDTAVTVTIELEFRILPDGSVVDVLPARKADVKLEEIAVRYLKKWRFNALSEDDKSEYVGTIPVTFKIR